MLPGWSAAVDAIGNLLITRPQREAAKIIMRLRIATAGLVLAVILSCAAVRAQDTLRVGTDVDAAVLDPRIMRDTTAYRVDDLLFDGLVELDAKSEPKPGLAKSWDHPDRHDLDIPPPRREVPERLAGDRR